MSIIDQAEAPKAAMVPAPAQAAPAIESTPAQSSASSNDTDVFNDGLALAVPSSTLFKTLEGQADF